MRIQIYPDGVITIDTDPPNDAEPERDSQGNGRMGVGAHVARLDGSD